MLNTIMILSFWTDRPGQTVELLQEQSDLQFSIPSASFGLITSLVESHCLKFSLITANFQMSEYFRILQYL